MLYMPCSVVWFQINGKNFSWNEKIIVILVLCVNMDRLKKHDIYGRLEDGLSPPALVGLLSHTNQLSIHNVEL